MRCYTKRLSSLTARLCCMVCAAWYVSLYICLSVHLPLSSVSVLCLNGRVLICSGSQNLSGRGIETNHETVTVDGIGKSLRAKQVRFEALWASSDPVTVISSSSTSASDAHLSISCLHARPTHWTFDEQEMLERAYESLGDQ